MKYRIIYIGIVIFILFCLVAIKIVNAQPKTEWTVTTLKEYFEGKLDAIQLAVIKAEQAAEKRFESINEFRGTLTDQNRTFMPRLEQESRDRSQDDRITANETAIKKIENVKQGGNVVWAYVIGGFGLLFGIISISLNIQKRGIK